MNKTKLKRSAENAVREILNAYNRRADGNDLSKCHEIAERHLRAIVNDYANAVRSGVEAAAFKTLDAHV